MAAERPAPELPELAPRWQRQVLGAGAVLGLLVIIVLLVRLSVTVAANQAADTNALCALRGDLRTRVNSTTEFLKGHPHGIPGISAATLRSGIVNEQHTITALAPISCPRS